jgi:hypothetical protein
MDKSFAFARGHDYLEQMLTIVMTKLARLSLLMGLFVLSCYHCLAQSSPAAEIKFREMHPRKPPLVELVFDVVLRNDRDEARWFLLPTNLDPHKTGIVKNGGVDALEVFAPRGQGRVVIGRFLGTGGFQALLLPAHAEIHLQGLPISYWGDAPSDLQIEIRVAKRLTIADEPARKWFQVDPTCSARANIAETISGRTRMLRSKHTPNSKEVPTLIDEDHHLVLRVFLK